jgi:hypothetical protein
VAEQFSDLRIEQVGHEDRFSVAGFDVQVYGDLHARSTRTFRSCPGSASGPAPRSGEHYDSRPRYEYHLTAKGAELVGLLMVMVGWGDRWLAGEAGPPVLYRHHAGEISSVDLRCAHCGEPMHAGDVDLLPGPGAAV